MVGCGNSLYLLPSPDKIEEQIQEQIRLEIRTERTENFRSQHQSQLLLDFWLFLQKEQARYQLLSADEFLPPEERTAIVSLLDEIKLQSDETWEEMFKK